MRSGLGPRARYRILWLDEPAGFDGYALSSSRRASTRSASGRMPS